MRAASSCKKRCAWLNLENPLYVRYHDEEWGVPVHDDQKLFELLILECFQAGLSWECILNKRVAFRAAFDDFELDKVCAYTEAKVAELMNNAGIVRHRKKIEATISNARIFKAIQAEFGSFDAFLCGIVGGKVICEPYTMRTTSPLSDKLSAELKKRGMKFVGSTIIYSYLQAVGVLNAHGSECDKFES